MNIEIFDGYVERKKILNPIFNFGQGMQVSNLQPYLHDILLLTLLEIFYREIKDDENRTRNDIFLIVQKIILELSLDADYSQIERIVNGVLWSGDPKIRNAYIGKYYDPSQKEFVDKSFLYLIHDRDYTEKQLVYKLSEEAQNIIFLSREVIEEFSVEFEQVFAMQLIRKGNFNSAAKSLDVLMTKVKNLIQKEYDYRREFMRNPQTILRQGTLRKEREKEIRIQFDEEKQNFLKMSRIIQKTEVLQFEKTENGKDITVLENKIQQSIRYHQVFANEVYGNISLELEFRLKNPSLFFSSRKTTLQHDIWVNMILEKSIVSERVYDIVLQSFFSPLTPFIFPESWAWKEHEMPKVNEDDDSENQEEEEKVSLSNPYTKPVDWNDLALMWQPVFKRIITDGQCSINDIDLSSWNLEAIECWMMFKKNPVHVPKRRRDIRRNNSSQVVGLLEALLDLDSALENLLGSKIYAIKNELGPIRLGKVTIDSMTLFLERDYSAKL